MNFSAANISQSFDRKLARSVWEVFQEQPWCSDDELWEKLNALEPLPRSYLPALRIAIRKHCKIQSTIKKNPAVLSMKEAWVYHFSLKQLREIGELPSFDVLHKESIKLFGTRLTGLILSKIQARALLQFQAEDPLSKDPCFNVDLLPVTFISLENDMPAASTPSTTSMKKTSVKEADLENLSLTVMALEETVRKALAENESLKAQLVNVQNTLGKISEAQQKQAAAVVAPVTPPPQEAPRSSNEMNFLREILAAGYEIRKAQ